MEGMNGQMTDGRVGVDDGWENDWVAGGRMDEQMSGRVAGA